MSIPKDHDTDKPGDHLPTLPSYDSKLTRNGSTVSLEEGSSTVLPFILFVQPWKERVSSTFEDGVAIRIATASSSGRGAVLGGDDVALGELQGCIVEMTVRSHKLVVLIIIVVPTETTKFAAVQISNLQREKRTQYDVGATFLSVRLRLCLFIKTYNLWEFQINIEGNKSAGDDQLEQARTVSIHRLERFTHRVNTYPPFVMDW